MDYAFSSRYRIYMLSALHAQAYFAPWIYVSYNFSKSIVAVNYFAMVSSFADLLFY